VSLPQAASASQLPTLEALSERAAAAAVSPGDVCGALALAEALAPAAGCLRAAGLRLLAERCAGRGRRGVCRAARRSAGGRAPGAGPGA